MKRKTAVVIGRFQPVHRGHLRLVQAALQAADQVVFVLGSANGPRSLRNPFTVAEREEMIRMALGELVGVDLTRLSFSGVRDYFYNDEGWTNEVRQKVMAVANGEVILVGHSKDATSSYLRWFPDWTVLEVPSDVEVHATGIRQAFLRDPKTAALEVALSESVTRWLGGFALRSEFKTLQEEQLYVDEYQRAWKTPFPPVFVTTDALLVCCGHLLLIQRKHSPGRGLWAIPGGFLDPHERITECAIRELREETEIEVASEELMSSLVDVKVFDHPLRSSRGRTITHAHLFRLNRNQLPAMRASDDAAAAKWVPLLDIGKMENILFEDHFHMINRMLGG